MNTDSKRIKEAIEQFSKMGFDTTDGLTDTIITLVPEAEEEDIKKLVDLLRMTIMQDIKKAIFQM